MEPWSRISELRHVCFSLTGLSPTSATNGARQMWRAFMVPSVALMAITDKLIVDILDLCCRLEKLQNGPWCTVSQEVNVNFEVTTRYALPLSLE